LKSLYDFENKKVFFPDVHASFKFCAMIASPSRTFSAAECGFYLHSVAERANPDQAFPIAAADFAKVNPNTGTAPIFRTRRDMALTTAIYARCPVLVNKSGDAPVAAWPVKYHRMFDMTLDSAKFSTRATGRPLQRDMKSARPASSATLETYTTSWDTIAILEPRTRAFRLKDWLAARAMLKLIA
jgi:hypothetical protein